jgi:hypothetical protein
MLNPDSRVLLRSGVRIDCDDAQGRLMRMSTREDDYEIQGLGVRVLRTVFPRLTGDATIAAIASDTGIAATALVGLLEPFVDDGVLLAVDAGAAAKSVSEFLEAFTKECHFGNQVIVDQPFWELLFSGDAPIKLVHGWGIEFFHFVEAANEYMAAGVAHCRENGDVRERLAQHYVEEASHGEIFLQGLVECGFDRAQVQGASPLASTRALINFLVETAIESTLTYSAALALMQTADASKAAADALLYELIRRYQSAEPLFRAFHRHTLTDLALGHQRMTILPLCVRREGLGQIDRNRAIAVVRGLTEHFVAFFDGIHRYYTKPNVVLPRRQPSSMFCRNVNEER